MNLSVPLWLVIALPVGVLVLWLIHRWCSHLIGKIESAQRTNEALVAELIKVTSVTEQLRNTLAPAADQLAANMGAVPKLLEGVSRIAGAQLEIMQAQRAESQQKQQNPFGRTNAPIPPRDATGGNLEDEVQRMMRAENMTREEAMLRMNPANGESVWGQGFFNDWGQR